MKFFKSNLPYASNALEPYFDQQTMEIHHGKHHQAYADKLNIALEGVDHPDDLTSIIKNISSFNPGVRNNGGGLFNHDFFWTILSGEKTVADNTLNQAIEKDLGGIERLQEAFNLAAANRFGSGWAWVYVNEDKKLEICSTPNQDNPLMDIAPKKGVPILGLDVWEHAYYLKYQNKRPEYIKAFWNIVNWQQVSAYYHQAIG